MAKSRNTEISPDRSKTILSIYGEMGPLQRYFFEGKLVGHDILALPGERSVYELEQLRRINEAAKALETGE